MAIADSHGLPIALHIETASRHEAKLAEATIDNRFISEQPRRMVGDKAYDDDQLDKRLRRRKIIMISPHRNNRKKPVTQDGRELRRYKRRWKVERLFSWLLNFRRVNTRWDFKSENFAGFVKLAGIIILLRNYF